MTSRNSRCVFWLTTVISSPTMPTSGRRKWHNAVMAAMLAASIRFPSWFNMWISTLICHTWAGRQMFSTNAAYEDDSLGACVCFTFSPDTTHRDSVSIHLEFLRHLSSCLLRLTDNSDCLQTQNNHRWPFSYSHVHLKRPLKSNNALSLTCPLQTLVRPVVTAQCWKTRSLHSVDSL